MEVSFEGRIANTAVGLGTTPLATVGLNSTNRAAREEILHRAYEIWERKGRPENNALANWLEAEAQILNGTTNP